MNTITGAGTIDHKYARQFKTTEVWEMATAYIYSCFELSSNIQGFLAKSSSLPRIGLAFSKSHNEDQIT